MYYNFDLTTPGGTVDFTQRSAGNAVKIKEGTEHSIGTWDLSWGVGTSNGQRQFTRSGKGCTIRLYVTITKLEDLFD